METTRHQFTKDITFGAIMPTGSGCPVSQNYLPANLESEIRGWHQNEYETEPPDLVKKA